MTGRVVSGIIAALVVLFLLLVNPTFTVALIAVAAAYGQFEYLSMFRPPAPRSIQISQAIFAFLLILLMAASFATLFGAPGRGQVVFMEARGPFLPFVVFYLAFVTNFVIWLWHYNRGMRFIEIATYSFGLLYLIIPLGLLTTLVLDGRWWPTALFVILSISWTSDAGAYFTGKWFGEKQLAPSISQRKTWEGLIGGAITGGISLCIFDMTIAPDFARVPVWVAFLVGFGGAAFAHLGDLSVSMIKRSREIKDSGRLIPYQGGLLDKLDSFIFAIPVAFLAVVVKQILW
jgi:phosphatidate cytidylyltransferase